MSTVFKTAGANSANSAKSIWISKLRQVCRSS